MHIFSAEDLEIGCTKIREGVNHLQSLGFVFLENGKMDVRDETGHLNYAEDLPPYSGPVFSTEDYVGRIMTSDSTNVGNAPSSSIVACRSK